VANQGRSGHHAGMSDDKPKPPPEAQKIEPVPPAPPEKPKKVEEIGGPPGPEPTRYGDWQFNGKVTDF
jgi:hypothetical protein